MLTIAGPCCLGIQFHIPLGLYQLLDCRVIRRAGEMNRPCVHMTTRVSIGGR